MHKEITEVARELYKRSGRIQGRDLDNWLKAEKLVITLYGEQEKAVKEKPAAK